MNLSTIVDNNIVRIFVNLVSILSGGLLGFFAFQLSQVWPELRTILKSVVIQGAVALLALYTTSSGQNYFISAFLLAALFRFFFEQYQDYKSHNLDIWFKTLAKKPSQSFLTIYFAVIVFLFMYSLLNFIG
ncbi:MAG: hypothetical protein U9M98_01140 [Patescibacteria group bacterium]|nr:hypothetical protein [Patescibacteria group bacterium]